jgi:GTP:adenosylcobinamide-phosphate guanylyltransferase
MNSVETLNKVNIIVQAGGRGSRLRHHTWNKPKCLVSINGKPILYHLFDRFPDSNFYVIGDYAFDVMKSYLEINPPKAELRLIKTNEKGTSSGIAECLNLVPPTSPLLLTWSDLIIGQLPPFPDTELPIVCLTSAFTCRWSLSSSGKLEEITRNKNGVAGLFYFKTASLLPTPPIKGEFVKWFSTTVSEFSQVQCNDLSELGDFPEVELSNDRDGFSRYFNKIEIKEREVIKTVINNDFNELHENEKAWYKEVAALGYKRIPKIFSTDPLIMERIIGRHAYEMTDLTDREKGAVLTDYLESLTFLHEKKRIPADQDDAREVYVTKTINRIKSVATLIPHYHRKAITINGKKCANIFCSNEKDHLEEIFSLICPNEFAVIHGDPTFSNSLVDESLRAWFIDPRGYFYRRGILGDPWYDFAKVYYSAVGGYDLYNRRKFKLYIDEETVEIFQEKSIFYQVAESIFNSNFHSEMRRIRLLHGLIWLSLSGYAKDDVDSAIGAFYLGLYWLESAK